MEKKNKDIRKEITRAGLTLWQVGERWKGISEVTMVRRLRHELTDAEKDEIREAIKKLQKEDE